MLSKNNMEKSNSSNNVCLPDEILNHFVQICTRIELNAGEPFISQDEFDESIFFIESGEVEVEKSGKIISILKAGDVVGEMAFIERRPRIANVRARTACVLLKVERADLLRELGQEPDLLMEFVHAIEKRRHARIEPRTDADSQSEIESFLGAVTKEGISHRAVHHPYLLALRDGKLPDMKWALADFARQYHGYSSHFPRYLTTVIGRLERSEHRIALMENLTEESGKYEEEELDELAAIGIKRNGSLAFLIRYFFIDSVSQQEFMKLVLIRMPLKLSVGEKCFSRCCRMDPRQKHLEHLALEPRISLAQCIIFSTCLESAWCACF